MPQPYDVSGKLIKTGPRVILERPQLAVHIACIAATWALAEVELGRLLAIVLGVHAEIGITIHQSLASSGPKRAVLLSAGKALLSRDHFTKLEQLDADMRKRMAERDRIIHGIWSITDTQPDALLLSETAAHIHLTAVFLADTTKEGERPKWIDRLPNYALYKETDLAAIAQRITALTIQIHNFRRELIQQYSERPSPP